MAKNRINPGDIVIIPLGNELYTFGHVLTHGRLLIYRYSSNSNSVVVDELIKKKRLLTCGVDFGLEKGKWKKIGHAELPSDLLVSKTWKGSTLGKHLIDLVVDGRLILSVPREQGIGLPRYEVWSTERVAERLGYYFRKEKDPWTRVHGKLGMVLKK